MSGRFSLLTPLVERLIIREMRAAFGGVHLVAPMPEVPERPVVLFGNHHSPHDGFALWYLASRVLNRRTRVWMREWERFPFFSAAGGRPFPTDEPAVRARTIRRTGSELRTGAASALVYFPEGVMHPAEEGVLPWNSDAIVRIDRILGGCIWLPVALHTSWRKNDRPELFILPGEPGPASEVTDERLADLLASVPKRSLETSTMLLSGRGSSTTQDFRWLAGYFSKRL